MTTISCFAPVATYDARVLILGSMPGVRSLEAGQYYAHPQNAFWRIMASLLDFDPALDYARRLEALTAHGIALWDVLGRCQREGSLDAAIRASSLEANDFAAFLRKHQLIEAVFFNGATAARVWQRHVAAQLSPDLLPAKSQRLPSTSPAYASMPFAAKLEAWAVITRHLRD